MPSLPISFLARGGAVGAAVLIGLLIALAVAAKNTPAPNQQQPF